MAERNNSLTMIAMIGIVLVAFVLAFAQIAKNSEEDSRTITVSGLSEKEVMPDMASVFIKIYTLEKEAKDSQTRNSELSANVISALKDIGIKESEIETSSYYVQQRYEWNEVFTKNELAGYETVNILKITTNNIANVGRIIDTGISSGANGIDSISFRLKKETEDDLRNDLISIASEAAKIKAESLASALNVELDDVKSVTISDFNYFPYIYRTMGEKADSGTQILPQKITVNTQVNVIYEIE